MNQSLKGKKVALIGGVGFIGHNLALHLQQLGADVSVVDGLQVNNFLALQCATTVQNQNASFYTAFIGERLELLRAAEIPVYVKDARDYHALAQTLTTISPDVIVHLSAVAHAGRSNKDPSSSFHHSLGTLEHALNWTRGKDVHFIFFSSSMAYGHFKTPEVSEDHPLEPLGIYGALKVGGEKLVIAYGQVFDLPYTIIRPSALYGQRCVSRRVGQIFIENAIQGIPLRVDGDGTEKLDFTYIGDLAQGVSLVIEKPAARGEIFNLTYGRSRSIQELVDVLLNHFPDLECKHVERDQLMPFRGTLSIDKAREQLGYAPKYPIERGFAEYVAWYEKFSQPYNFTVQAFSSRREITQNANVTEVRPQPVAHNTAGA